MDARRFRIRAIKLISYLKFKTFEFIDFYFHKKSVQVSEMIIALEIVRWNCKIIHETNERICNKSYELVQQKAPVNIKLFGWFFFS